MTHWMHEPAIESLVMLALILHVVSAGFTRGSRIRSVAMRLGYGMCFLWLVLVVSTGGLSDPSHFASVTIRSLLLAVSVTGVLTLVFSAVRGLYEFLDGVLLKPIRRIRSSSQARRRLQAEEQRQLELQQQQQLDHELAVPQDVEAAERGLRQQQAEQAAQQQREQIRFDVRLFYDRYRRELVDVFPEEKFDAYFQSFLKDSTAPEVFEQRAERLKDMIRDRLELSSRHQSTEFTSIDEVIAHYDGKRQLILKLPVDDEVREDFLMQLDDSMERDLREFL